jgi:NAD(P)-dependent dehydrogenase (short-subunit alcohol dehydrogenase family)
MHAQKAGSIINISSTYGHKGAAGASIYAASKHAVEGLTKSVALEVAEAGVRVNAVAPGPIDTGMLDRFTGGEAGKSYFRNLVPGNTRQRVPLREWRALRLRSIAPRGDYAHFRIEAAQIPEGVRTKQRRRWH